MSISSEQAMKMVDEKMAREAQPAQPEPNEKPETEQPAPEPKAEEPKAEDKKEPEEKPEEVPPEDKKEPEAKADEQKPEDQKPEEDEKKASDRKPPKQKYSHAERVAHAFSIEKQKRKEQHAKDQARIKELEEKLKKYEGLKLDDFEGNVENFTNWKLEERDLQNEVKTTKERIEREEAEMMARETERRVNLSFESDEERDDYNELIRNNGPQFYEALQKHDPKGVVLDYLNSVEKYPIVLRELMTNMDSLRYVFRDKDPVMLRINLAAFTKDLLDGKAPEKKQETEKQPEQTKPQEHKPAIPVTGRQVTASAKPSEPVHDRAYWNQYLREHPNG